MRLGPADEGGEPVLLGAAVKDMRRLAVLAKPR